MMNSTRRSFLAGCLVSLGLVLTRPLGVFGRGPSGRPTSIVWAGQNGARVEWWAEWRLDGSVLEGGQFVLAAGTEGHTILRDENGIEIVLADSRRLTLDLNRSMETSFGTMEVLEIPVADSRDLER